MASVRERVSGKHDTLFTEGSQSTLGNATIPRDDPSIMQRLPREAGTKCKEDLHECEHKVLVKVVPAETKGKQSKHTQQYECVNNEPIMLAIFFCDRPCATCDTHLTSCAMRT